MRSFPRGATAAIIAYTLARNEIEILCARCNKTLEVQVDSFYKQNIETRDEVPARTARVENSTSILSLTIFFSHLKCFTNNFSRIILPILLCTSPLFQIRFLKNEEITKVYIIM